MYGEEEAQHREYLAASCEEVACAQVTDVSRRRHVQRTSSIDSTDIKLMLPAGGDRGNAAAVAEVLVAREKRKAAVGVAECMVRMKELDALASVEKTRLTETGATERFKVAQEQQSLRAKRWAEVADTAIVQKKEMHVETVRQTEDTKRQAISASERVETERIKSADWQLGLVRWAFGSWLVVKLLRSSGLFGVPVGRQTQRRLRQVFLLGLAVVVFAVRQPLRYALLLSARAMPLWRLLVRLLTGEWSKALPPSLLQRLTLPTTPPPAKPSELADSETLRQAAGTASQPPGQASFS
eukprot:TRINITY_DN45654_c0_g1_i1.p1 TRINITY_DN45654_c0_g1~~TRINITY_DN45654_c0_g1_i1.p1  ORF type:complete len:297 (-),score=95.10 TRINITY_DN45654_c0_g1_i1:278-1168(-)